MKRQLGSVCLEGSDQSGKSYVAELLHKEFGYPIHHFSAPKPDTDFRLEYIEPMLKSDKPFIFDRSYVSEIVYGDLYRGGSGVTPDVKEYIEHFLNLRNCVLVYLKRPDEKYKWIEREGEMYGEEKNAQIRAKYDEVIKTVGIPYIVADSYDSDLLDKIKQLYYSYNPQDKESV